MKILHINNTYKPVGGAEVYIRSLSDIFKENGHEIFLFAIDDEKNIEDNNLFVYRDIFKRGPIKYFLWHYLNPTLYLRLNRWIKNVSPDVIHIHNNGKFSTSVLLALQKSRAIIIQTVHDYSLVCPIAYCVKPDGKQCGGGLGIKCPISGCISWFEYAYRLIPECLNRYVIKITVNQFIAPSKKLKQILDDNKYANVVYLPNFIDSATIEPDFNKTEKYNITYVGRLSNEKGLIYLIKAIPEIITIFPSCILHLIGGGPIESELKMLVKELNIEKTVIFHGRVSEYFLNESYKKATIIIMPSIWMENNPIVALEAMAFGKPIIASNTGGYPDLIDNGITGFLIEPRNSDQIAKRIIQILSDDELAKSMGRNARKKVELEFGREKHINGLLEIYNNPHKQ